MRNFFEKFTLQELVTAAVVAALGIAIKPIVIPLAHIVCGPLMIPSGALAGGLYMMWLVIGYGLIRKPGSAVMISAIQALVVVFTGIIGSHGIMSFVTYLLPGIAAEIVLAFDSRRSCSKGFCVVSCTLANIAGTAAVNMVFFQAPGIYLVLILSVSAVSGIAGGVLSDQLIRIFSKAREKKFAGWVDDVDAYTSLPEVKEQAVEDRKTGKWILVVGGLLIVIAGITAWINFSSIDKDEGKITVTVEGTAVAGFELEDIMALEGETLDVNLPSTSNDDAIGDFTGVRLSDFLEESGIEVDNDSDVVRFNGEEYSVILLTAGDGYSSAADADEIGSVLLAYEKDGDSLGYYSRGGTGPVRALFLDDTYANRSVMNIVKIDLEK